MDHKVGTIFTAEYSKLPTRRYKVGDYADIFHPETHRRIARFEVVETDDRTVKGKIINTYGHKRHK